MLNYFDFSIIYFSSQFIFTHSRKMGSFHPFNIDDYQLKNTGQVFFRVLFCIRVSSQSEVAIGKTTLVFSIKWIKRKRIGGGTRSMESFKVQQSHFFTMTNENC